MVPGNMLFMKVKVRHQGIIQKKSVPGIRSLLLVIFDKKVPFFPKTVFFYDISE